MRARTPLPSWAPESQKSCSRCRGYSGRLPHHPQVPNPKAQGLTFPGAVGVLWTSSCPLPLPCPPCCPLKRMHGEILRRNLREACGMRALSEPVPEREVQLVGRRLHWSQAMQRWLGPGEVCPGDRRQWSRRYTLLARPLLCNTRGPRILLWWNDLPQFWTNILRWGETAREGVSWGFIGGASGTIMPAPPQRSSMGTSEAVGTATKSRPAPP